MALLLAALVTLSGCERRADSGVVVVSAIGGPATLADPSRTMLDPTRRMLLDSVAQGLVRFDATGQIEPGLAERWIVIDDGMSYIFRLREATWSDGSPVTAATVVRALRRQLAPASRNPLVPFLTAVDEIVEMTPQVIEIRLRRPRPDLLKLFAQPELALFQPSPPRDRRAARSNGIRAAGTGPFRVVERDGARLLLRRLADPAAVTTADAEETGREDDVGLIGERAAAAVARFAAGRSDLVAGGSVVDWPLVGAAGIAAGAVRVDPAAGLFGLAVVRRDGFLAEPANRRALAAAIDRDALVASLGAPGWTATDRLLPDGSDSATPPVIPAWARVPFPDRRQAARAAVAAQGGPVTLAVALPAGPGATLVFGQIAASLRAVGITALRVGPRDRADLLLVDAVAPYDSARWYLATACVACGDEARAALEAARDAPTLPERARAIAAADVALDADASFIALARPLRWSLVSARMTQWQGNARAVHPLNHLRPAPN